MYKSDTLEHKTSSGTATNEPKNIYTLAYSTKNFYVGGAKEALLELLVLPFTGESQRLIDFSVCIEPNTGYKIQKNYLGFELISTAIFEPFGEFFFELKSRVEVKVKNLFEHIFLEPSDELAILNSLEHKIEHHLFLQKSKYTFLDDKSVNRFPSKEDGEPLFSYLLRLNNHIFCNFLFCNESTDVHTTAIETIDIGRGVCQDFAHIFIGVCRAQGIAARYVSGYLHQGHGYRGDTFLHAWVEVYIPNVGFIGLDPTNNLLVDEHYIKISHGIDYSDCTPIKGVLKTNGEMDTQYSVYVRLEGEVISHSAQISAMEQ